jgi:hypothetical protein
VMNGDPCDGQAPIILVMNTHPVIDEHLSPCYEGLVEMSRLIYYSDDEKVLQLICVYVL